MNEEINDFIPPKEECFSKVKYITDSLYVLNGKWKFPLIFTLRDKPRRFNEIIQLVEGITSKVLAKELKELEINGFIERKVYATTPVSVIYETTEYSDTLYGVLNELMLWGKQHSEKIKDSIRQQNAETDRH